MGEREDAEREFERVFGKVQKGSEQDAAKPEPMHAATQKLPGDSDVLGIRTDSDRFIFKNPIPERLSIEATAAPRAASDSPIPNKGLDAPAQDAMTIALNVNVFANIPKPGEESKPGEFSNVAWSEATQLFVRTPDASAPADGPLFAIPVNQEPTTPATDIFKLPSQPAQGTKQSQDFARAFGSNSEGSGNAQPTPTAKFTRVMHVQNSVTLPHPLSPPPLQNPPGNMPAFADSSKNSMPPAPPTSAGPSDFTRVVRGSELRALQEKFAAASGNQTAAEQGAWPVRQNASPSAPGGMATQIWSASSGQAANAVFQATQAWPAPNMNAPPMPRAPEPPTAEPSKLSQYMPLILVLNLLFLLAILLIVFFAVKK